MVLTFTDRNFISITTTVILIHLVILINHRNNNGDRSHRCKSSFGEEEVFYLSLGVFLFKLLTSKGAILRETWRESVTFVFIFKASKSFSVKG